MNLHLFSTDQSCMKPIDMLPQDNMVSSIIVPSNRVNTPKVRAVLSEASSRGLPVRIHQRGQHLEPDLPPADAAISWLYSQIFSVDDLNRYPAGILNMHGGKIPEYRGASVLHWAIINGEEELGITWHEIIKDVDAGPIWAESTVPIPREATAMHLRTAMIAKGLQLFRQAWARFQDPNASPRYPDPKDGRVWRQRRASDGQISKGWTERRVRDIVRAQCPPWPPAFVDIDGDRMAIRGCSVTQTEPGDILYLTSENKTIFLRPLNRDNPQ